MIELNFKIKNALIKMNFIDRYEELSKRFSNERMSLNERLVYVEKDEVMDTIRDLGYSPMFDTTEKFFKIKEEQVEKFTFGFHIILRDGMADLVWVVKENGELLLGAPWSTYSRRLIDVNYRIKKPVFGIYEDLEDILKAAFEMYEDLKLAFVHS